MRFNKHQRDIIKAINNKEVYDIESFVKKFNLYEHFSIDKEKIKAAFDNAESGKEYPVDVVKNLLDHGNKKRISVAAKLEYTDNIKKVTFDNCCYEYDLWDEKGFNIAIDYDEIVGFISLWEYLKRELDVFETEKEVSKSEIELFFRKYEKMTNMSNKTSNYIPIVEEETLRMIDDKLQRKVGDWNDREPGTANVNCNLFCSTWKDTAE